MFCFEKNIFMKSKLHWKPQGANILLKCQHVCSTLRSAKLLKIRVINLTLGIFSMTAPIAKSIWIALYYFFTSVSLSGKTRLVLNSIKHRQIFLELPCQPFHYKSRNIARLSWVCFYYKVQTVLENKLNHKMPFKCHTAQQGDVELQINDYIPPYHSYVSITGVCLRKYGLLIFEDLLLRSSLNGLA